jgi:hypothetical protein
MPKVTIEVPKELANRKDGSPFAGCGRGPSGAGRLLPGAPRAVRRACVPGIEPL